MEKRRFRNFVVFLGLGLALTSCSSTPIVQEEIGKPLVIAVTDGKEIATTTEKITRIIADLPDSKTKADLSNETQKLNLQVDSLNKSLDGVMKGYWKMINERSREQTKLHNVELLATKRLIWALVTSISLIVIMLFIFRKFIPF